MGQGISVAMKNTIFSLTVHCMKWSATTQNVPNALQ